MFIYAFVTFVEFTSKFYVKVSQNGYTSSQSRLRKHSYLGHECLRGSVFIPKVLAAEFMPRDGTGGQNVGHLKKCSVPFSFLLTLSKDVTSEISHPYDLGFCVMRWRSVWTMFRGWMILPNTFKTIWWMNVILWIIDQCDTKIDLIKYM